jgi:hypothetical protein
VDPAAYWGFVLLGRVLCRQERMLEAEEAYRQATEPPSDYRGMALEELAGCLVARGALFEARATLVRALQLSLHPAVRKSCEEALADVTGALRLRGA